MKKTKFLPVAILLLLFSVGCSEKPAPGEQVLLEEGFSNQVVDGYWLYLPKNYQPGKQWPLIMFLQGGDAAASPNPLTVKDGGPVYHLMQQKQALPDSFIVVNPHMRTGTREQRQWFQQAKPLVQIVDHVIANYGANPARVYLTGQSRGGHGTWGVARRYPEKFAALLPIAGAIICDEACDPFGDLPIWIMHNTGDPVVSFDYPLEALDYLENKVGKGFVRTENLSVDLPPGTTAIFTRFDSEEHGGAGYKAYTSPKVYDWLLQQKRE